MSDPAYIIGIDLGTTNSVVAYTPVSRPEGTPPDIRLFEVPQLTGPGTLEPGSLLPSFLLLPGPHDVPEGALALPWDPESAVAVGAFAKDRGAEIPHRQIASAKSWLCHSLVDRNSPILPWEGGEDGKKLSPVEASAAILRHIRDAWNHVMATDDPALAMENQDIFLTVPASFDAVARELTVQAASMAGLGSVTLLEEPQAAFYAWIENSGDDWRKNVTQGDLILVFDIGGGTSDFSLIQVDEADGDLVLERIAVGDHLLVGGDNMDLALAYTVARQLSEKGTKLDSWQMRGLWQSCRKAKEKLLNDPDAVQQSVTVLGRGSSLIGGTITTPLTREQVESVILDGFFPACEAGDRPQQKVRAGIRELGLAYEADPAVTRHLAGFVARGNGPSGDKPPTAILFNGGVMKAGNVRTRILGTLNRWSESMGKGAVREIPNADYDLAVARGAAYYGLAKRGDGIRIRGGLGRSYYIGVAASMPAVPGMPAPVKALCVAPFGMEEGTEARISSREFVLAVGEPVSFDFLGSSARQKDAPGQVVEDWDQEIEPITTIETALEGEAGQVIPVTLEVRVTEVGTLEVWCVAVSGDRRYKLEFNVREQDDLVG